MAPKNQRWWLTTDSVEVVIDATPKALYDLVSDMPRMGEWSNECARVEWAEGSTGPEAGARFVGHNAVGPRRMIKYSRRGRVLAADPGREFAFTTEEGGEESTIWRYRFEPVGGGTRVTESYEARKLPVWARIIDVPFNRYAELMETMRHTLGKLKAAAEASAQGSTQSNSQATAE
jgi:hypothetical protein